MTNSMSGRGRCSTNSRRNATRSDAATSEEAAIDDAEESTVDSVARATRKQRADSDGSERSVEHQARDAVYRLLAVRARSRAELRQTLSGKGFDEDLVEATLEKFANAGLVDDAAFAQAWVRERHEQQGLGRQALDAELRRKGVDGHIIADALSYVDESSEVERARELVRRKDRGMSGVDATKRMRRLVATLARKGYSEGLAFRIVREELERSAVNGADPRGAGHEWDAP